MEREIMVRWNEVGSQVLVVDETGSHLRFMESTEFQCMGTKIEHFGR